MTITEEDLEKWDRECRHRSLASILIAEVRRLRALQRQDLPPIEEVQLSAAVGQETVFNEPSKARAELARLAVAKIEEQAKEIERLEVEVEGYANGYEAEHMS